MPAVARGGEFGFILLLGALAAFGPLSIDLYLPALPAMAQGLGASPEAVQLSVTVFLAGFSLGMLFYGPISDRHGRRPVMLAGIALFALASLACLLVATVEQLIVARFFQAVGGGAASVLARAVARDVYAPTEAIRKLSLMAMVSTVAPMLAPLAGSLILPWSGWRGAFAALLLWGVLSLLVVLFRLPETLSAERRGQMSVGRAFAVYGTMLADPVAVGLVLAGGMSFAAMFAYITGSPHFFIDLQGFSPLAFSLVFATNALGLLGANYVNSRVVRTLGPARMLAIGCGLGFAGAMILLACLGLGGPYALGVIAGLFVIVSMAGLLGANCVGLLMARFPDSAGAAAAFFGASQFGFGMLASAGVSYFHDGAGRSMAWVIAVASSLALGGYGIFQCWGAPKGSRSTAAKS